MKILLRNRFRLMFLTLAIGPLLIVGLFIAWQSYQNQLFQALAFQKEISREAAVRIQSYFDLATDLLETQATVHDLTTMPASRLESIFSFLITHKTKSGRQIYQSIALLDEKGNLLACSALVFYCGQDYFQRYYDQKSIVFHTQFGQMNIGQLDFDKYSGEPYVTVSMPIINLQTGLTLGILSANVRFKEVWVIISEIQKEANRQIYVIDLEHRIVAHADPSVVLRQTYMKDKMISGLQKGLDNKLVIRNQTEWKMGNQTLHVIAEQPFQDAMSLSFRIFTYLGGAVLAGILSVLIFALIAERRFVQPVEKLMRFATKVKNGDLDGRISIEQNDELGELSRIFNEMTENLSEMVTRLQETIQQNERAFDSLLVSEHRFKAIFDNAKDSIIIADTDTRNILSVNEATCKMFGFRREELLLMKIEHLHPESSHMQAISAFEQMSRQSVGNVGPLPMKRKDNSIFFSEINTSTFIESGKRILIGLLRDVTQHHMTEQKLKEARDSAEATSKAKSQFLANMSHEIRTPLNAVIGYSDLLDGILTDERQKRHLGSIKTAGRNLLGIINDVLDLSKIEAGMMTITPQSVDLKNIFSEIERLFEGQIGEKEINFEVEFEEGLPQAIITDPIRLKQILINLVGNAIKYTEKGFVHVKVGKARVNEEIGTLDLSITIQDSGIGIPQDDLELIFESFRQQDSQSSRRFEGTGLGLSISKKLVELLNGDIHVDSTEGEGSRFDILLRNIQASAQIMDKDMLSSDVSHIQYKTGKVLIIDDELSNLYLINELLKKLGLIAITAISGKDGLNTARKIKPDIIIIDLLMLEPDGLEVVSMLNTDPETSHIPLVAISNSSINYEDLHNTHGIEELLSKPLNITKLLEVLNKYFEQLPKDGTSKPSQPDNVTIPQINKDQLQDLNKTIKSKFLPWYEQMKGVFKINDIKQFSTEIEQLGNEVNCSQLVDCSSRLMKAASHFDISAITKCLSDFKQLTEILKNLERNDG